MEILPISCLVRNRQQTDADNESVLVDPLGNSLRAQSQCECVGEDGLLLRGNTFHDETNLHRVAFFFFLSQTSFARVFSTFSRETVRITTTSAKNLILNCLRT